MKKKLFLLLFSLFFSIILIGCNKNNNNNNESTDLNNNIIEDENNNSNNEKDAPEIEKQSKETKEVRLFYFDTVNYQLYFIDKEVEVQDNAIVKALTRELQNYSPNKNFLNLTDKVEITSAYLDEKSEILKITFSSSYVNEMLLGSSTESGLLASMLATYGYNLNVNKIAIYFKDELYTSLKGDLPNRYFDVDYSNAIAYSNDTYNNSSTTSSNIKNLNCRVYYYNVNDDMYYYKDNSIEVIDSALVTALTKEIINIPNETFFDFKDDLSVTSAKLENNILTVNLSKDYYNILTRVGSGTESSALKTLALTYSYNYNVKKVIILVDGKPYKGSHIIYQADEAIDINLNNIKELQ